MEDTVFKGTDGRRCETVEKTGMVKKAKKVTI